MDGGDEPQGPEVSAEVPEVVEARDDGLDSGAAVPELDAFRQPTAAFERGQFLGELADLIDGSPDTRAHVEAVEQAPPKGSRFIVVAGPDLGAAWAFRNTEVFIGRDDSCDLTLSDIAVSRRHARVVLEGATFFVEDLGSNNGTLLNGDRLIERAELVAGDELVIGERTLRFIELNQAPATDASSPVVASAVVGSLEEFERSEIEPAVIEPPPAVAAERPRRGRALRRASLYAAVGAAGLLLMIATLLTWRSFARGRAEAERQEVVRTRFLETVALVKAERFGDAGRVLKALAEVAPGHPRLADYRKHIDGELAQWSRLQRAEVSARERELTAALEIVDQIPLESAYRDTAVERAKGYRRQRQRLRLSAAREALALGQLQVASTRVEAVLRDAPGSAEGRFLADEIARVRAGRRPRPPPPPVFTVPPDLAPAIAQYREGRVEAALDAAEAVGSDSAHSAAERMSELRGLLTEIERAHRSKTAAPLLELSPRALRLDAEIAGGKGEIKRRLLGYFADGLYLDGIVALQAGDGPRARRLFGEALAKDRNHPLARERLGEMTRRAHALYYEAQVLEGSDPEGAEAAYRRLLGLTDPSDRFHQRAKKRLRSR